MPVIIGTKLVDIARSEMGIDLDPERAKDVPKGEYPFSRQKHIPDWQKEAVRIYLCRIHGRKPITCTTTKVRR